jgi:hypothetical protein
MRLACADTAKLEGEIATAETTIELEAGEHAPRLLSLGLRGAVAWKNARDETLPDHVEMHDATLPLIWRLDRSASRFESKQIRIVYIADSPRLKAVSLWRARARADRRRCLAGLLQHLRNSRAQSSARNDSLFTGR